MKQTSNGNGSRPTATKRKTRVVTDTVSSRKKAADKMVADATVKQMSAALMSSDRSGNGKKVALAPVKKTADSSVRRADLKSSDAEKTRPVRVSSKKTSLKLSPEEIERLNTSRGLMKLLKAKISSSNLYYRLCNTKKSLFSCRLNWSSFSVGRKKMANELPFCLKVVMPLERAAPYDDSQNT